MLNYELEDFHLFIQNLRKSDNSFNTVVYGLRLKDAVRITEYPFKINQYIFCILYFRMNHCEAHLSKRHRKANELGHFSTKPAKWLLLRYDFLSFSFPSPARI